MVRKWTVSARSSLITHLRFHSNYTPDATLVLHLPAAQWKEMSFPNKHTWSHSIWLEMRCIVLQHFISKSNITCSISDLMFQDLTKMYYLMQKGCRRGCPNGAALSPLGPFPAYPLPVFHQKAQITGGTWTELVPHLFKNQSGWGSIVLAPSCDLIMSVNKGFGRQRWACSRGAGLWQRTHVPNTPA